MRKCEGREPMNNGRPWFKFFPADWLGSRETRFLTPEERGYLIQLISEAWQSEPCGSLPADTDKLWRLAGAKSRKQFEPHAEAVLQSFYLEGERYWNQQLVSLHGDMEAIGAERRIAGKLGANKRWQNSGKRTANATDSRWQTDGDIEEIRKEKEKEVDPEKQLQEKAEGEPKASSFGRIAGL